MDTVKDETDFDEDWYLSTNPDVASAVHAGLIESGLQHYRAHGRAEGRKPSAAFDPTSPVQPYQLAIIPDACAPGGAIEFIELQAASLRVPPPPRFFFGDFPHHLSDYYFQMGQVQEMGIFRCRDVAVAAPYLLTRNSQLFACPQANIHQAHLDEFLHNPVAIRAKTIRLLAGDCAMIFGPGHKMFGHWIVDFFPKLFLLERAGHDISALYFPLPSDVPSFAAELLRSVGIPADHLIQFDADTESVRCERLLLPTTCHNGLLFAPLFAEAMTWLASRIEAHSGPLPVASAAQRIFVSRGHAAAGNRILVNRAEIEAMAVAEGFVPVYPEELPLLQQFAVFAGAREIIGEYGAGLHTAVFSRPGTVICALRGNGIHPGFGQSGIAEALGHHLGYVIGTNVSESWDFKIEPDCFAAALRSVFGAAPFAR